MSLINYYLFNYAYFVGKHSIRRQAIEQFRNSAMYARNAGNYDLVMTAARHYWNAIIPLVSQPIERELLREPTKQLLQCITDTTDKKAFDKKSEDEGNLTREMVDPAIYTNNMIWMNPLGVARYIRPSWKLNPAKQHQVAL